MKHILLLPAILILFACSSENETSEALEEVIESSDKISKSISEDTYSQNPDSGGKPGGTDGNTIDYKEMVKYFPNDISGYEAQEPQGSNNKLENYQFSTASRKYVKEGGYSSITISIVDYNDSEKALMGAAYWMSADISVENTDGYQRTFEPEISNSAAFETYSKKEKNGNVFYVIDDRFYVNLNGEDIESNEILKETARAMKLARLGK